MFMLANVASAMLCSYVAPSLIPVIVFWSNGQDLCVIMGYKHKGSVKYVTSKDLKLVRIRV